MMLELERDLVFRMYDFHDLTKEQLRERTMEKVCGVNFFFESFRMYACIHFLTCPYDYYLLVPQLASPFDQRVCEHL
jgi:hypothetical protein